MVPSLVMSAAPCWLNGLTTDCTYWFCDSDLTVSSTACLFWPWTSEVLDSSTIGTLPLACSGRYLSSRSVADWEPVPGSVTLSFSGRPVEFALTTSAIAITTHAATTHGARRAANAPILCITALIAHPLPSLRSLLAAARRPARPASSQLWWSEIPNEPASPGQPASRSRAPDGRAGRAVLQVVRGGAGRGAAGGGDDLGHGRCGLLPGRPDGPAQGLRPGRLSFLHQLRERE